ASTVSAGESSSADSVSCKPAGASSRELTEFHGVGVGSLITRAPALVSLSVITRASSTWSATRTWPATRRPTSIWSIKSACGGSANSIVHAYAFVLEVQLRLSEPYAQGPISRPGPAERASRNRADGLGQPADRRADCARGDVAKAENEAVVRRCHP